MGGRGQSVGDDVHVDGDWPGGELATGAAGVGDSMEAFSDERAVTPVIFQYLYFSTHTIR